MLEFTIDDAVGSLRKAGNLNASIKSFLKREVQKGDPVAKFAKDLRGVATSDKDEIWRTFLEKSLPEHQHHLVAIGNYAHWEFVSSLIEKIAESHADAFNATYSVDKGEVTFSDKKEFEKLASQALKEILSGIEANGFGSSSFMMNVILVSLFEEGVIDHVMPLAERV